MIDVPISLGAAIKHTGVIQCHRPTKRSTRTDLVNAPLVRRPSPPVSAALGLVMEMRLGRERYWTTFFEDKKDGFGGYRLHREVDGKSVVAAEVIFWDATGGFTIQTFGRNLQIEVAQALIAEAQAGIQDS